MISHHRRFVFIHVPKTAGTSVRRLLGGWSDAVREAIQGDRYKHLTASDAMNQVGHRAWSEYFTFAFVRNPWERMLSYYAFHRQGGGGFSARPTIRFCRAHSFPEFLERYINATRWQGPQFDWLSLPDGTIPLDFVGRVENLEEDFRQVCTRLGVTPAPLPRLNVSSHRDYAEYYDAYTRSLVARAHERDVDYFGYRFGG
jgi:hypothetical protein